MKKRKWVTVFKGGWSGLHMNKELTIILYNVSGI